MKRLLLTAMLLCIAASTGCNGSFSPCFLRRDAVDICDPCQAQYDGGLLLNNGQRPGGWLSRWWNNWNVPGQTGYTVGYPGTLNGCGCEGGCDSCNGGCDSCGGGCSTCNSGCSSCGNGGCSTCNGGAQQAILSNEGTLITPDGMTISQDGQLISPGNGAFVIPNAGGGVTVGPTPAEAADSVPTLPGPAKKGM